MKNIYVREYTKTDGTIVKGHYRQIDDAVSLIASGNHEGAKSLIGNILKTIPEEKDALAKTVADGGLSPQDYQGYLNQLTELQKFEEHGSKFKLLSDNGLDVTESAKNLEEIFGQENVPGAFNLGISSYTMPQEFEHKVPEINTDVSLGDKITSFGIKNAMNKVFPSAGEAYRNATTDMEDAKNNPDAKVYDSYKQIEDKNTQDFLKNIGVSEYDKGAVYGANSSVSKRLADSEEIDGFVKGNFDELIKNPKQQYQVEFKRDMNVFSSSTDNFAAFQHATVLNPTITKEGVFKCDVVDYYDFEHRDLKNVFDIPVQLNNHGYRMQESRNLKKNFYVMRIEKKIK